MQPVISTSSLSKSYGEKKAVDGLTIEIPPGQLFGLLGPNGSGKTTIIKMLTGQTKPSSGSALVMGKDAVKDPIGVRELIGVIPEQENPPSFLTAEEYLQFVGKVRGLKDADRRASRWFKLLDFAGERQMLCKDLSRGTRQKLMFAQAFLHEPKLAFIDEPLINLDPISQETVKGFLKMEVKKGTTIFFSTHVLEIAQEICTHIGIIDKGRLVHTGKVTKGLTKVFLEKVRHA